MGVADEPTGVALITVDAEGETEIVVAPGANTALPREEVSVDGAVLCQLEIPPEVVEAASEQASFFFLNAAPARPVDAEVVRRCNLVVVNRYELDALPETPRLTALTLGAEGAVLLERGDEVARARPPAVDAVDGTAAGDAFTAVCGLAPRRQQPRRVLTPCVRRRSARRVSPRSPAVLTDRGRSRLEPGPR